MHGREATGVLHLADASTMAGQCQLVVSSTAELEGGVCAAECEKQRKCMNLVLYASEDPLAENKLNLTDSGNYKRGNRDQYR